ncbi:sensor histidine kinase [Arcicella rigui]|uniref:histidine kinase n=1 Tax=Arcicella rigui TaxID=797020 RepID=A0ABU5QAK1_9BACT|nr:PAS domain S-box protein [Arcicella rigui]MEA5139875.1 PAS domain S-box protein [Arcicella rigui]
MDFNKLMLDAVEESTCIINRDTMFVAFNTAYENFFFKIYGTYPVLGEKRLVALETDFDFFTKECIERVFKGESFKANQMVNEIYWEFSFTPIFDGNNKVEFLMLIIKETTQTNKLIKAVTAQKEEYQYVVENMRDVLFQTDTKGNWIFLNKAWNEIFQFTVEESLGRPFFEYLHPDDVAKNALLFEPLIKREKTYCRHAIRYIDKAGKIKWMQVFATLLLNENDEIIGTTGTLRDTTNEKMNAHFSELLSSNVKDLIVIYNLQGNILYASPSCNEMLGYTQNEMIGRSAYDFFYPDDIDFIQKRHRMILENELLDSTIDYRLVKKNGDYLWVETTYKVFFDDYEIEDRVISVSRDITEKKLVEESMLKALQKEKELNEMKTRFVAMTAHEFKTPLSTISSSAEIIEMYVEQIEDSRNEKIVKQLTNIHSEIVRITNLMNETLFLGKIESENTEVHRAELDLVSLIRYIMERQNRHQRDGRTLEFEIIGQERKILADAQHLEHIIDNLVSNAFKYSQKRDSPKLILFFNEHDYQIYVIDYGIGIPVSQQKKVYSSFFRGSNVGSIKGTGLGLLIVHNLVQINGGEITFESTENMGTTFKLKFPYA